jgi:proteasome lid subunit RPN8/RPN11
VEVSATAHSEMLAHAVEGYPLEICGLLAGTVNDAGARRILEAWPVRNAWELDPELRRSTLASLGEPDAAGRAKAWDSAESERRFLIDPRELVAAMRRARAAGLDLVGVYHTHPNHPAQPSEFDREMAWPDWSYLIVSVRNGQVADVRSWVLDADGAAFVEEAVQEHTGSGADR